MQQNTKYAGGEGRYKKVATAYLLFFTISITSLFGFTAVLTGSHAESSNPLLYGLSFYTASIAFFVYTNRFTRISKVLQVSNPILLFSGPIALFIRKIGHKKLLSRIYYYTPFFIIGFFFFQVVGAPLTESFYLIEKTDVLSVFVFATIFEIFVYANFCGISLMLYSMFGLLGYKIPLNFKQPFSSANVIDYWKGWHTSLSIVLKTLFFNPVKAAFSTSTALFTVYIASALWHGISFNFVLWGLLHAITFIVSIKLLRKKNHFIPFVLFIFSVVFGRLLFLEGNSTRLLEKLSFTYSGPEVVENLLSLPNTTKTSLAMGALIVLIEFFFRKRKIMHKRNYKYLRLPIPLIIITLLILLFSSSVGTEFAVYGQR